MSRGSDDARDGADWISWDHGGTGQWPEQWPPVRLCKLDDTHIRFEITPPAGTGNKLGGLHGGFLATYAEHCLGLFVEPFDMPISTVTVSINLDYPAGGKVGVLLSGRAELIRETRRMQFVRIELEQEGEVILLASGVLRKVPRS